MIVLILLFFIASSCVIAIIDSYLNGGKIKIKKLLFHFLTVLFFMFAFLGSFALSRGLKASSFPIEYIIISGAFSLEICLSFLIIKKRKFRKIFSKKQAAVFALIVITVVSIFSEATLFNYRHYESLTFGQAQKVSYTLSDAFVKVSNGVYSVNLFDGTPEIFLNVSNQKINNIYIDVEPVAEINDNGKVSTFADSHTLGVIISISDEGHETAYPLPLMHITGSVPDSKYMKIDASGKVNQMSIRLTNLDGRQIRIGKIVTNTTVENNFSVWRLLAVIILLSICYATRPRSPLYTETLNLKLKWQKAAVSVTLVLLAILICSPPFLSPYSNGDKLEHRDQYEIFSKMLKKGQLYFDYEVDPALANLKNPYDNNARANIGADVKWDHAYHDGKYYMYFGIVPEVTTFLPYLLITGKTLDTIYASTLSVALLMIGIFVFMNMLAKKYFPGTSFALYIIMSVLASTAIGITLSKVASMYSIPISFAVMFGIWGLYFWMSAKKSETAFSKGRLFLGSLCIAFIFGCRPQVGIVMLIALPLFWKDAFKNRLLLSKKSFGSSLCLMLPFVAVAAGLMWYNFARFGSPFDFGATYNLTTNDMTKRGIKLDRTLFGLFSLLFQPIAITAQFPFVSSAALLTTYQGITITEGIIGGCFFTQPILAIGIFGYSIKEKLKKLNLWQIWLLLLSMSLVICFVDIQVSGILERYICDFSWLLYIAAAMVLFQLSNEISSAGTRIWFNRIIAIVVIFCLIFNLLSMFFASGGWAFSSTAAEFHYTVANLVEFWK
ncbi:MAG: hypothetical protein WCN92_06135 [Eubacteriales bacterium]